jgi:hypothetical protein
VIRLFGVDDTSGVNLDVVHVNSFSTDSFSKSNSGSITMITIGGGEMGQIRSMFLEIRFIREVSSETSGTNNHGSVFFEFFFVFSVNDTDDISSGVLD